MTDITQEDREERVAQLFDALHNPVAAKAVRMSGLCGTVHHAAADFLDAHRIAAEQAVLAKLRDRMDEDWFDEIIQDSFDMDWTSRDGARAIIRAIEGVLREKS